MAHFCESWAQSGMRSLRLSSAGALRATSRWFTGNTATCSRATSSLGSTAVVTNVAGRNKGRSLTTPSMVRYSSGAVIQTWRMHPALKTCASIGGGFRLAERALPSVMAASLNFSTSGAAPKEPPQSVVDNSVDGVPVAEAGVAEVEKPMREEPRHAHVKMPSITEAERTATLTSWNVKVGDEIAVGDVVCEIELEHFSVGVKVETTGFLAEILVEAGTESVPVGTEIGTIVHTEEDIALYQQAQIPREAPASESEVVASESQETTFSWKDVLKVVLRLRKEGKLSEDDASALMSLARHKDSELLQAFEGCIEGVVYDGEIDDDLFLAQALDIAKTRTKAA